MRKGLLNRFIDPASRVAGLFFYAIKPSAGPRRASFWLLAFTELLESRGMDTTKVKKLKELEKENTHLKRLVADLSLGF